MCFSTRYIPTRSFPQTTFLCPWSIEPTADWRCLLDYLLRIRFSIDMKLLPMWVSSSSTSCLCSVIIFHFVGQARNLGRILDPFLLSSPYLSEAPGAIFFHPHHGLLSSPSISSLLTGFFVFILTAPNILHASFWGDISKLNNFTLLFKILQWLLNKVKIHCDI